MRIFAFGVAAMLACGPALAQVQGQSTSSSTSAVTLNSSVPDVQRSEAFGRQRLTGTQRVLTPGQTSFGLAAAGIESCSITAGIAGAFPGGSVSLGIPTKDDGCDARLDARQLWAMGFKAAAAARMCQRDAVRQSMPDVCQQYAPQAAPVAQEAPRLVQATYPAGYGAEAAGEPPVTRGGPVEVIEKRTGRIRLCAQYDPDRGRCLAWAR